MASRRLYWPLPWRFSWNCRSLSRSLSARLTRPSAVLMAFYTLGTSLIEHRYWAAPGADKVASLENFYKNLSIMGGFLLLYVTGAGQYSVDAFCNIAAP